MVHQWLQNSFNVNVKGAFPVGYSNQAVNFSLCRCLHTQKLLLFLSKPGFSHQTTNLLPSWVRIKEGDIKFPCLKWLSSLRTLEYGCKESDRRDPKSKQSKATFFLMRRGGFILVVFYTFFFFFFCKASKKKKKWKESFYKRVYSSCLCVEEVKAHRK